MREKSSKSSMGQVLPIGTIDPDQKLVQIFFVIPNFLMGIRFEFKRNYINKCTRSLVK